MRRAHLKAHLARALCATGADAWLGRVSGAGRAPLVVGYHRVVDDLAAAGPGDIPPMLMSRRMLERQLDWIGRRHRFVTLDELGARLEAGEPFASPVAAVTFDDGYQDVYDHAFPLLVQKGIPAAVFVVTDWIGGTALLPHDRLHRALTRGWPAARDVLAGLARRPAGRAAARDVADPFGALRLAVTRLSRSEIARVIAALEASAPAERDAPAALRPLTWEALARMSRAGITVGSHTRTHAVLTLEDGPGQRAETVASRRALQERLGVRGDHFAYPDGAFDPGVVEAVAGAGYRVAYTTCRHRDPRHPQLTVPRVLLWESSCLDGAGRFSPAVLSCLARGIFDLAGGCRRRHRAPVPAGSSGGRL
jgi:peptidoglycan/xylan/chitin deacetylase (PgdA/CDA1 family)